MVVAVVARLLRGAFLSIRFFIMSSGKGTPLFMFVAFLQQYRT